MNSHCLSNFTLQELRRVLNSIKKGVFDYASNKQLINRLYDAITDILRLRSCSLEFLNLSQNKIEFMSQDCIFNPYLYFYTQNFASSVGICYDDFSIEKNFSRSDKFSYHIKCVNFEPQFIKLSPVPHFKRDILKSNSPNFYGDFETLDEAKKYYYQAVLELLLSNGLKGVEYGLF